ncbi:MAG: competence/damage-inducible protein A [Bacteroidetes bacterium]|nr:competence/damage-inducible protein A [Bacteroidota bacterium]MCL5738979.1 competence/damage-inducible protein A [Bacteroidota bacterium]
MKTAAVITIGDEILIGQVTNTNAAFIGQKLSEIGMEITRMVVVGDEYDEIMSAFKEYYENFDAVLVTGGLGPTHDDITKKVVADFFNVKLVMNNSVLENVRDRLSKRNIPVIKVNEEQALVPEGCEALMNHWGTAPGMLFEKGNKFFAVMPGVPYEMQNILTEYVVPRLKAKAAGQVIKHRVLKTTGIAESALFQLLGDVDEILGGRAKLAFLPSQFGVRLRITVKAATTEEADSIVAEVERKIRSKAEKYIYSSTGSFGEGEVDLEEAVGKLLRERKLTISAAESCTGGYISHRITNISGSSAYFERGVVSYSNKAKMEILHVPEELLVKFGAVSEEVALAMAEGIRKISGTDISVSVTGIAGPTGGTPDKPVGLVYIGVADSAGTVVKKHIFPDERIRFKDRASQAALELVRKRILGLE